MAEEEALEDALSLGEASDHCVAAVRKGTDEGGGVGKEAEGVSNEGLGGGV